MGIIQAIFGEAKSAPIGFAAAVVSLIALAWGGFSRRFSRQAALVEVGPGATLMPVVAAIFWAGAFSALWATIMHLSGALGFTFFLVLPLLIWWLVDRALATEQQQNIADVIVPSALASGIYVGAVLDLLGRSLGAEMGSGAEDSMSSVQGFLIIAIFLTVAGGVFVYFHVKSAEKRRGERF